MSRAKIFLLAFGALMLCGLRLLVAQEFRIKKVKIDANGPVVIDCESDPNGRFTLLQGSTVTNITTPVLTSPLQTFIQMGALIQLLPAVQRAGKANRAREETRARFDEQR